MATAHRLGVSLRTLVLPIRSVTTRPVLRPSPQIVSISTTPVRYASHAEQGRANGPKQGPGKRLGAKKTAGELVVPGNIIFRQRGTKWHPGENCARGRDHTIYATEKGYVQYYRDPKRHPKQRFIGVALEKDHTLPTPLNAARRRNLNMIAVPFKEKAAFPAPPAPGIPVGRDAAGKPMPMVGKNNMFTPSNYTVGTAMKEAEARRLKAGIKPFKKNDRWLAWRKRSAKMEYVTEQKRLARSSKKAKAAARKGGGARIPKKAKA